MASIDKTYVSNYEDYVKVRNWCMQQGEVQDHYGNRFFPINFLYDRDLSEDEWNSRKRGYLEKYPGEEFELILWNTPTYFDIWLIRFCPIDFVQERLKFQYGKDYEKIKNRTSIYDTYRRDWDKNCKYRFKTIWGIPVRSKNLIWFVEIREPGCFWNYDLSRDRWFSSREVYKAESEWTSSCATVRGALTKKNILKLIRKWKIPRGCKVWFDSVDKFEGKKYRCQQLEIKIC